MTTDWTRRRLLLAGANAVGLAAFGGWRYWRFREGTWGEPVVVTRAPRYDEAELLELLRQGLSELGVGPDSIGGRTVLLKPNLVEPCRAEPHINTHPSVVAAAVELFRAWGAREVLVGEGAGHCPDTGRVLEDSGYADMLRGGRIRFVDLNHDDVDEVPNRLNAAPLLGPLMLPRTLLRADLVVSMAKLKTHHLMGATLTMKNLFGVMPGVWYGWPKNHLHCVGIGPAILDITATVRPQLAIVDGVVGMEGDGPIMGTARDAGVLVMGRNPVAVDATAIRLMGFDPTRMPLYRAASGTLGPVAERNIEQRGERLSVPRTPFESIISVPLLGGGNSVGV